MQEFSAKIYKVGINPAIDVPRRVSEAFRKSGYIPVKGRLNASVPFRATLCPTGGGNYRLYINGDMRRRAGVVVGKRVLVQLGYDSASRELPVPDALKLLLAANPPAQIRFDAMAPSHRHQVLEHLNSLKSEDALKRNLRKLLTKLNLSKIKVDGPKPS